MRYLTRRVDSGANAIPRLLLVNCPRVPCYVVHPGVQFVVAVTGVCHGTSSSFAVFLKVSSGALYSDFFSCTVLQGVLMGDVRLHVVAFPANGLTRV